MNVSVSRSLEPGQHTAKSEMIFPTFR